MEIKEKQLFRVPYTTAFYPTYHLKDDVPLVLNDISIYAINHDNEYEEKVDFDILTDRFGTYIAPKYNPKNRCKHFLLVGCRLAMCKQIVLKANEYIDKLEYDGNITFTIEETK